MVNKIIKSVNKNNLSYREKVIKFSILYFESLKSLKDLKDLGDRDIYMINALLDWFENEGKNDFIQTVDLLREIDKPLILAFIKGHSFSLECAKRNSANAMIDLIYSIGNEMYHTVILRRPI